MGSRVEIEPKEHWLTPWPLALARRVPRPELSLPLGIGGLWLVYFAASGALFPDSFSANWTSSRQITGMALMFASLLGYLAGFFLYTSARSAEHVEQLRPLFSGPEAEALVASLNRLRPGRFWVATAVGVALGCFNIDWTNLANLGRVPNWPMDLSLVLGSMTVWIVAAQVIYSRAHDALLLSRLGRSFVEVDVFQPDRLGAFARVGILDFLLAMGALALTPLQALDAEFRYYNYSFAFAVVLPGSAFLLLAPMWGIHQRLLEVKARALAAIEADIAAASRGHDEQPLLHLNALVERRAYLRSVHTWPMDLRAVSRVGFYLIIPPLAWIAAALVEMLVENFLARG
jgi:hypothetical protein